MPPKRLPKKLTGFASRVDPGRALAGIPSSTAGGQPAAEIRRTNSAIQIPEVGGSDLRAQASGSCMAAPSAPANAFSLADRSDRPALSFTRRGSMELAIAQAATTETRRRALEDLEDGFWANSSKRPRASYLRTWERFHREWFGDSIPVLPLTVEKLKGVGALFKAGKYRGISNSMGVAKSLHLELGHTWTEALALTAKRIERSVTRGIGPASQCKSLALPDVIALDLPDSPLVGGGPVGPSCLVVAGSFFMLREIEASLALWKSVTIKTAKLTVTWVLPASKSDPKALGKTRTWGCTCTATDLPEDGLAAACPYHAMLDQRTSVQTRFGLHDDELGETPVFPDSSGRPCTKQNVVRTFRQIAVLLGFAPEELEGIGGHLCRVSGAQHMAMMGLDVVLIRLMARWAGEVVLRYIAEAPLGTITDAYKRLASGKSLTTQLDDLCSELTALKNTVSGLAAESMQAAVVADLAVEADLDELRQPSRNSWKGERQATTMFEETSEHCYLVNRASGKYHMPYTDKAGTVIKNRAKCGWRFIDIESTEATILPRCDPALICGACLPAHRRACRASQSAQLSAPVSNSASSSSSS